MKNKFLKPQSMARLKRGVDQTTGLLLGWLIFLKNFFVNNRSSKEADKFLK